MGTTFIVCHGTSQDDNSLNETTKKLADALKSRGYPVHTVAGPGSSARAIAALILNSHNSFGYSPIFGEDRSTPSLFEGYIPEIAFGTALGYGCQDNAEAVAEMIKAAVAKGDNVYFIGFSRGAVTITMALNILKKQGFKKPSGIIIKVGEMDPVPGPSAGMDYFGIPSRAEIPAFVDKVSLLISRDEARFGFRQLDFQLESSATEFDVEVFSGGHGDIGGSACPGLYDPEKNPKGSPIPGIAETWLIRSMGLEKFGIIGLSDKQIADRALYAAFSGSKTMINYILHHSTRYGDFGMGENVVDGISRIGRTSSHMDSIAEMVVKAIRSTYPHLFNIQAEVPRGRFGRVHDEFLERQPAIGTGVGMIRNPRPFFNQNRVLRLAPPYVQYTRFARLRPPPLPRMPFRGGSVAMIAGGIILGAAGYVGSKKL